jgi:hypothetical protein
MKHITRIICEGDLVIDVMDTALSHARTISRVDSFLEQRNSTYVHTRGNIDLLVTAE